MRSAYAFVLFEFFGVIQELDVLEFVEMGKVTSIEGTYMLFI